MTGIATTIAALTAAGAVALSGATGSESGAAGSGSGAAGIGARSADAPAALVIDASAARDGRELVDPRLTGLDAEVRLPRTAGEARTNVRYFDALGYRIVVAGPRSTAAADATGVGAARATGLSAALARL